MPGLTTQGIVLRASEYRDYDRILSLLTPSQGVLSVAARASRRAKSPLLNASQPFAQGEFVLTEKRGRYAVASCSLQETYYPLREEPLRVAHGALWLSVCEDAAQPGYSAGSVYRLLLEALAYLAYGDMPPENVSAPFLLHLLAAIGMGPELNACVRCGAEEGPWRFDPAAGGVVCPGCLPERAPMPSARLEKMRRLLREPFGPAEGECEALFNTVVDLTCARFERTFKPLDFLRQMERFESGE